MILLFCLLVNPMQAQQYNSFHLYVFNEKLEFSDGNLWNSLKNIDLNKNIFVITEYDIDKYNWSEQSIILNKNMSNILLEHVFKGGFSKKKKHTWSMFEYALHLKQFLVVLKNKKLYGGLFIYPGSNTYAPFPVIYPKAEIISYKTLELKIKLILRARSQTLVPHQHDYNTFNPSLRKEIEIKEVYDFFDKINKLTNFKSTYWCRPN